MMLSVELPGDKRIIDVPAAADLLTATIPDLLMTLYLNSDAERAEALKNIESLEIREALLSELLQKGFVAFVPNGAILPRESGSSDLPKKDAVPFESPKELLQTFEACGKKISGMAIPKGITIIAGGAYHGKSTLLSALESSVVPHVLGDGREWIVTDPTAMRIAAEPGRIVKGTRIAPLCANFLLAFPRKSLRRVPLPVLRAKRRMSWKRLNSGRKRFISMKMRRR